MRYIKDSVGLWLLEVDVHVRHFVADQCSLFLGLFLSVVFSSVWYVEQQEPG